MCQIPQNDAFKICQCTFKATENAVRYRPGEEMPLTEALSRSSLEIKLDVRVNYVTLNKA